MNKYKVGEILKLNLFFVGRTHLKGEDLRFCFGW